MKMDTVLAWENTNPVNPCQENSICNKRLGDCNQTWMDLRAIVRNCYNKLCEECLLKTVYLALQKELVSELPKRKEKPKVPHYVVTAVVIRDGEKVLIAQRAKDDMLGGMWEFPGRKLEDFDESLQVGLKREILEELSVHIDIDEPICVYKTCLYPL